MGELFCLQYYENTILNNIIFLFLFMIVTSTILKYNDVRFLDVIEPLVIALMLMCLMLGS